MKILIEFPDDYERFCYIKDKMNLYDNNELIKDECLSCKKTNHSTKNCPYLHFIPVKSKIIS